MAVDCLIASPDKPKELELLTKLGGSAAYRLFMKYAPLGRDRAIQKSLDQLDPAIYSPEEKKRRLASGYQRVQPETTLDGDGKEAGHTYRSLNKDRDGKYPEIKSVSATLDDSPQTEYNGADAGKVAAERGVDFHKIPELIFRDTYEDEHTSNTNLNAEFASTGIPISYKLQVESFRAGLEKEGGTFLTEVLVEDLDNDIAGTVDLVHIKDNGSIDIYDYKTSFFTSKMLTEGKESPWDPSGFDGYKGRRYHAQLEFYARMVENMTGIPVSNKYIVPIEVYNKDNDLANPYTKVEMLKPENVDGEQNPDGTREPHPNWPAGRNARRMVDKHFGTEQTEVTKPSVTNPQGINTVIANVIGDYDTQALSADKAAEQKLLSSFTTKAGITGYINTLLKRFVPFKSQDNKALQKNQIIQEETSKNIKYLNDISESVFNWFESGDDRFLSGKGFDSSKLKSVLNKYMVNGQLWPGTEIYSLDSIEGFADKKNWIVLQRNNQMDLIYIGNENLSQKIAISGRKKSFSRRVFGDTLFGKHYTAGEARWLLKSNLKNTVADAKKFEGALIMLELKATNSKLRFGDAMITSLAPQGQDFATHIDLERILPVIQNLIKSKNKQVRDILPSHFQGYLSKKDLFDWSTYKPDLLRQYSAFIKASKELRDENTIRKINDYYKDKLNKQDLDSIILLQIGDITSKTEKSPEQKIQLQMLSKMHAELVGMNIYSVEPVKMVRKLLSMPTNIANTVIQHTVSTVNNALSSISREFFDYKPESKNKIDKLFKDQGSLLSGIANITVSNTSRFYEGLFQTVAVETSSGKIEQVRSFELIEEGTDAFAKLSDAQQEFIIFFNDTVQYYTDRIQKTTDKSFKWKRGRIPLLRGTFANKVYKLMYAKTQGHDTSDYKDLSEELFQNLDEGFTFDNSETGSKNLSQPLTNPFIWQRNDVFGGGKWDTARGLVPMENGNYLVDSQENYGQWSTNLEVVLDMFVINAIRVEQFNKIMPTFMAAQNLFEWQKSKLLFADEGEGSELDGAIQWLKVWKQGTLENKSQDAGTVQDKIVRTLNKTASVALIGFRPQTAIFATLGQELTAMSQAIAQGASNSSSFGFKNWARAGLEVWNPKNVTKDGRAFIDGLLSEYRMFNHDFSSMVNDYHRAGNKSYFRTKSVYMMLNAGDWGSRAQILVAQMMNDGVWEAYSMGEDGKVLYDETKDKRFQTPEGKILKATLKRELATEKGLNPDGTMKRAYDSKQANSLKFEADSIVGGFDRETRALYNYWAMGKLFMLFKTWLPARLNKGFDEEFMNQIGGSYELVETDDGSKEIVWKGKQMEGIMFSFLNLSFNLKQYLRKAEQSELTQNQQENLKRMLGDILLISTIAMAASALAAGLKDDEGDKLSFMEDEMVKIIARSTEDLIATYNIFTFATEFGTPISIRYTMDLLNNVWNALAATTNPNDSSLEHLAETTSVTRSMYEWTESEE
jgi:hypothetical protein